jgi:hypothetical protein
MFLFGVGLGCVLQVLVIATQNAVPRSEIGVATSGVTFFRSIGGSFGTAIFGAIFTNLLVGDLRRNLAAAGFPANLNTSGITPKMLSALPITEHAAITASYTSSLDIVFRASIPVAVVAFVLALFLPKKPMNAHQGESGTAIAIE